MYSEFTELRERGNIGKNEKTLMRGATEFFINRNDERSKFLSCIIKFYTFKFLSHRVRIRRMEEKGYSYVFPY